MRIILWLLIANTISYVSYSQRILGTIRNEKNEVLPFSTILIKGTPSGTTANAQGFYFINVEPGTYTIICQHVGYARQEKTIKIELKDTTRIDFVMQLQTLTMQEVVVKKGEDPAYEIIRQSIKKRPEYKDEVKEYACEVYIKGQLKLRDYPKKFLGQKVDFEDGDTSKKKMIFLSETIAKYSVQLPDNRKVEVLSTKVSGQSDGYGFSSPLPISFYENNISIGRNLNQRGFISPISDGALRYYKYKYEGSFFENGLMIHQIKIIPRRKYEPVFSGIINIIDDEWRIHSVKLELTKQSQMEFVDTLKIEQLYTEVSNKIWMLKSQVIYPAIKFLGFDATGNFLSYFSKYDLTPSFTKKSFNNVILKIDSAANKKTDEYWDTIRPVPLLEEEVRDYERKDSLEEVQSSPGYSDSVDRRNNKFTLMEILVTGANKERTKKRLSIYIPSLLQAASFNTVEGWALNFNMRFSKRLDSNSYSRRTFIFEPTIRYGFSNKHFNAFATTSYVYGKKFLNILSASGGKKVSQINNENPITPFANTWETLLFERNYMKLYEAWYGNLFYQKGIGDGFTVSAQLHYEDRIPLENTNLNSWKEYDARIFTPNYPVELVNANFARHQAFSANVTINWRPGAKYIELPERTINIGSKYPNFQLSFTKGIKSIFGSDVDYSKWHFGINDNVNFNLAGRLDYKIQIGGFFNTNQVQIQDFQHFKGNRLTIASEYQNSFQLAQYYIFSNIEKFYAVAFVEHHFNGLLTNKIPVMKNLNWHLVLGANALHLNKDVNYLEALVGIENILKVCRVNFVMGFQKNQTPVKGIRISVSLFRN